MKNYNILKYLSLAIVAFMFSCEEDTDGNFSDGEVPTSGWIEFSSTGTALSSIATEFNVPLDINVPIFQDGLTISYELQPVEGDFDDIVTSPSSGSIRVEADNYEREASIPLTFGVLAGLPELITFDVVLTAVNQAGVRIGVGAESTTRFRVSSPCPFVVSTWSGDYSVAEVFTGPPNAPNGLSFFFGESYGVTLSPLPGDLSGEKVVVNNTPGFDTYLPNGTEIAFITCTGEIVVNGGEDAVVAGFRPFTIESATFDADNFVLQADGPLATFGQYQWVFTKL